MSLSTRRRRQQQQQQQQQRQQEEEYKHQQEQEEEEVDEDVVEQQNRELNQRYQFLVRQQQQQQQQQEQQQQQLLLSLQLEHPLNDIDNDQKKKKKKKKKKTKNNFTTITNDDDTTSSKGIIIESRMKRISRIIRFNSSSSSSSSSNYSNNNWKNRRSRLFCLTTTTTTTTSSSSNHKKKNGSYQRFVTMCSRYMVPILLLLLNNNFNKGMTVRQVQSFPIQQHSLSSKLIIIQQQQQQQQQQHFWKSKKSNNLNRFSRHRWSSSNTNHEKKSKKNYYFASLTSTSSDSLSSSSSSSSSSSNTTNTNTNIIDHTTNTQQEEAGTEVLGSSSSSTVILTTKPTIVTSSSSSHSSSSTGDDKNDSPSSSSSSSSSSSTNMATNNGVIIIDQQNRLQIQHHPHHHPNHHPDHITAMDIVWITIAAASCISSFIALIIASGVGAWRYYLSGGICAAISHIVPVPIDVVKTRKQIDPCMSNMTFQQITRSILLNEGPAALLGGFGPTAFGYLIEGSIKFGVYEVMKPYVLQSLSFLATCCSHGSSFLNTHLAAFIVSAGLSGIAASIILCPMEAIRIRMVAHPDQFKQTNWMIGGYKIIQKEGTNALSRGMIPMLLKQVPYTITKNVSFDFITKYIYMTCRNNNVVIGHTTKLAVPLVSAGLASILSCLTSQPGDLLLSLVNANGPSDCSTKPSSSSFSNSSSSSGASTIACEQQKGTFAIIKDIFKSDKGIRGFFVGMSARFVHVGIIVTLQLLIYDYVKRFCGIAATGI